MHFERTRAIVITQPEWFASPECDPRHVAFLLDGVTRCCTEAAAKAEINA